MIPRITRRRFLHGAGCAACAAAAGQLGLSVSDAQAQAAYERLDAAERDRLADMALDLAARAGAGHADLRICRYRWHDLRARDGRLERTQSGMHAGFGVRLLVDGAWGFAGSELVDEPSMRHAVTLAAENAAAMRRLAVTRVTIEPLKAYRETWTMPVGRDPFAVPDAEKIDLLLAVNEAARAAGADYSNAYLSTVREEKFFASSVGSRIEQTRVRVNPGFTVTAVNSATGRFAARSSLSAPRAAGWDYVVGLKLAERGAQAAPQAREKLKARRVAAGTYDLVIDATNLWLTLHECIGHSTELDRALGWEANYAGTSFVTPEIRGTLKIGSPLMNVMADRTQEGGLSTVGYDDDGVKPEGFAIIRDGVFRNYQMALGQAQLIGEERSNGCAYAESGTAFPIQRMPNISLVPNPAPTMSRRPDRRRRPRHPHPRQRQLEHRPAAP